MAVGCAGLPEAELEIVSTDSGKPSFRLHPEVHFSLSHGSRAAVCALSRFPVGVDLETMAPRQWWREIAGRWFTEKECALLEQAGTEAERIFYHLWTRKEAWLKLQGKAIWRLSEVPDTIQPGTGLQFLTWEGGSAARFSLSLCHAPGDTAGRVLFQEVFISPGLALQPVPDDRFFPA
jgi:phosphopantetheinyl transferase